MLSAALQGAFLSALSNILAQVISATQRNDSVSIAWRPVLNFFLYALITTPPNVAWQQYLESAFPAAEPERPILEKDAKNKVASKTTSKGLNKKNTAIKVLLDQTLGGALNAAAFLAFFAYLQKPTAENVAETVKRDLPPIYAAGLKLWPLVSILCFTAVPVQQRVLVGSLAGIAWNIYLSLQAGA